MELAAPAHDEIEEEDDEEYGGGGGGGGWSLRRAMAPVFELASAIAAAVAGTWRRWYVRLPLLLGGGLLAFAAALGLLLAPVLDRLVLPGLVARGREVLQREVRLPGRAAAHWQAGSTGS